MTPPSPSRFNYWTFILEGALFGGALSFVNANTLLPAMVDSLGGGAWLIALMPVIMLVGFRLPPIFTAHHIERLREYKPFLVWMGLIQRLPFGAAAIALFWTDKAPLAALAIVASVPLLSGIFGGIGVTAWQQLLTKCVPVHRRHSLFAIRFAIMCVIGIFAGETIRLVLTAFPGTTGYALLHLCAFLMLLLSLAAFAFIREPHEERPHAAGSVSLVHHLRSVLPLIRHDAPFLRLLVVRFFLSGIYIVTPFLAIHCLAVLEKPDSYLGRLIIVQMIGAIAGNLTAAWLGDRFGSKITIYLGAGAFAFMSLAALGATSDWQWQALFFLFGFAFFACEVGTNAIGLEMGPRERRSTYLAVASLANLAGMLTAAGISTVVWEAARFTPLAVLTIAAMAATCHQLRHLAPNKHVGI